MSSPRRHPDLPEVLVAGPEKGWASECLDGTLIASTLSSTPSDAGRDMWYSGKHERARREHPGLSRPGRLPEWVSPVEPGSTHDLTAARQRALPAFYPAAAAGLPTLNDTDTDTDTGAGIGIIVPTKGHHLAPDNQAPQPADQLPAGSYSTSNDPPGSENLTEDESFRSAPTEPTTGAHHEIPLPWDILAEREISERLR